MLDVDVIILGAGPAGVVLGRRLSALGYAVVLFGEPRAPAWEGMSARVVEGLRRAGCEAAVAACQTWVPRAGQWNAQPLAPNRECLVDRREFDAALWRDARAAGLRLHQARVRRVQPLVAGWLVEAAGDRDITARGLFLVEARGRRAPRAARLRERGPKTVALARLFGSSTPPRAESGVASFAEGWAWFAAWPDGKRVVQLVVSAQPSGIPARGALAAHYAAALTKIPAARDWIGDGVPASPVIARDATSQLHDRLIGSNSLRVGDAAMSIDPLSGHGTFEAIGGALASAAVVNTLMRRRRDLPLAQAYYEQRAAMLFQRHARVGRAFYAREQRWPDRSFWAVRRRWLPNAQATGPAAVGRSGLVSQPVVEDDWIVEREVVITPRYPRGVFTVDGVAVAPLLRLLHATPDGQQMSIAELARRFAVTDEQMGTARAWLRFNRLVP